MAANKTTTLVFIAKDQASGVVKKLDASMDGLGKQGGKLGGVFGKIGGAAKAMAFVGIGAAIAGIAALGVALAAGVKGALDEEVGITRLDTALKNNIAGWDGNRAAIEKVIDARTRLAFDDSALRDSLSALVVRTKDVTAAMDLQRLAMDLARLRGIDLATATEIVGKVYGGNIGILTRYGIAVEKGATSTEALVAIQKMAGGQAEAYGKTTKGAFESFNVAINNVFEDIGSALLPGLTGLATFLSTQLIPTVKDIAGRVGEWFKANEPLITQIKETLGGAISFVFGLIGDLIAKAGEFISWIVGSLPKMGELTGGFDSIGTAVRTAGTLIDGAVAAATGMATWITSNKPIMAGLKFVADAIADAFGRVAALVGSAVDGLDKLATWIRNNGQTIRDFLSALPFLGEAIKLAGALDAVQPRARGGPVQAGRPYVVGERGPELFMSGQSGQITPGVGGLTINGGVHISGVSGDGKQMARDFLQELKRETGRQGVSLNGAL